MLEIGLFWEEGFPTEDTSPQDVDGLRRVLDQFDLRVLGITDLDRIPRLDLLVLPFGSAFPAEGWPLILAYLRSGGNLLNLGGMPFTVPCTRQHVVWKAQPRQDAYLRELGLGHAHAVDPAPVASLDASLGNPILADLQETLQARALFALTLNAGAAPTDHLPGGMALRPLLRGLDASGRPVASPVVAVDHLDGAFRGGRWVFALLDGTLPADLIRRLAFYAALGASDLTATPSFPCYYPGEAPRLAIHASLVGHCYGDLAPSITVTGPQGQRTTAELPAIPYGDRPVYRWSEPDGALFGSPPLTPGFYSTEVTLAGDDLRDLAARLGIPPAAGCGAPAHHSGFWVWDGDLAKAGPPLTTAGPYLAAEGLPRPACAVRYDPTATEGAANPSVWDAELRLMRDCGIGMVRLDPFRMRPHGSTPEAPRPDEALLRAVDALLLSARRYGLVVSLDPLGGVAAGPYRADGRRSAEVDLDLLAAFVERYQETPGIVWEFHRVPASVRPPGKAASDPDDLGAETAWHTWIAGRDDEELRSQWGLTAQDSIRLFPGDRGDASPAAGESLRRLDVALFSRELARRWLAELRQSIVSHGAAGRLIASVPNCEASPDEASVPLAPGSADLAFTGMVSAEEESLPKAILAGAGVRPALVQLAAGAVAVDPSGHLRTSEREIRNRLERMFALGMAAGSAGVALSPWKPGIDGEIGFLAGLIRADGSVTPALAATAALSEFLQRIRPHLQVGEPEPVVLVTPTSHRLADPEVSSQAVAACIRTFHARNRMALRAVGEYDLEGLGDPRLLLLPYPRVLRQETWDALLGKVSEGACLLVTGPVDRDPYWHAAGRLAPLGLQADTRPVARQEQVSVAGRLLRLHFGAGRPERVDRAIIAGHPDEVLSVPYGGGKLLLAQLPFELADGDGPLAELYEWAIAEAGVERAFEIDPIDAAVLLRPLAFTGAVLYALLSEAAEEQSVTLLHGPARIPIPVRVPAGRAVLLLVERQTGVVLDRYDPVA